MRIATILVLFLTILFSGFSAAAQGDPGVSVNTHSARLEATPTLSLTAYTAGDLVGSKITLTDAVRPRLQTGIVTHVTIHDLGAEAKPLEVIIFCGDPSSTTFTDNAAFDVADADLTRICGSAYVSSWSALADNGFGQAANLTIPLDTRSYGNATTSIYAAIVARDAVTYDATNALTLTVGVVQD